MLLSIKFFEKQSRIKRFFLCSFQINIRTPEIIHSSFIVSLRKANKTKNGKNPLDKHKWQWNHRNIPWYIHDDRFIWREYINIECRTRVHHRTAATIHKGWTNISINYENQFKYNTQRRTGMYITLNHVDYIVLNKQIDNVFVLLCKQTTHKLK